MAGHSKFKNIMHRKGAQDAKRAKIFTQVGREIMVAVKTGGGPDPDANAALRSAIQAARAVNMPNDRIDRAVKRASGADGEAENFEEVRYEGYGNGGVAIIVETLTDNRHRTAADVRAAFNKHGGSLGETNSVAFMFDRIGQIVYENPEMDADAVFEAALEAGAENVESSEETHEITTAVEDLTAVRDALESDFGTPNAAKLAWRPQTLTPMEADQAATLFKLIEVLDEHDDVQTVYANFDVSDEVMAQLADG
jgi:YebC/PmpR family DNA-binding regulatory protein